MTDADPGQPMDNGPEQPTSDNLKQSTDGDSGQQTGDNLKQPTDGDSGQQTGDNLNQPTSEAHRPDGGYATDVAVATDGANWPRLRQIGTLAATEYRLTVRSRWAYALTGLFAIFGLMLATFSGSAVGPDGMERVVASLTNLAVYLVPLAGLAVGYDAIVGRDEQGWLAVVFSLPVTRAQVVIGTYFGRAVVLAGSTIVGFGVVGFVLLRGYGASSWPSFLWFLGAAVAVGAVFLAIAVLVSTLAREKTHALGVALLVWLWFVLIHDLISLGIVAATSLPEVVLTGMVLANPASVFRVLVLTQLGTAAGSGLDAATATTGLSTGLLVASLLAWIVIPLALATLAVYRRRL